MYKLSTDVKSQDICCYASQQNGNVAVRILVQSYEKHGVKIT